MTVAIVTHNVLQGDGQGRVNYELAHYLLRQGVAVCLVADRVDSELLERGAHWVRVHPGIESPHLLKVWRFKQLADRALEELDEVDVILGCGVSLGRPHAVNAVHFVHGTWLRSPFHASRVGGGPQAWYQWLFSSANARWEREVFRKAECVVAVSEMVREELQAIGVPAEKIEVIVNGVDLEEFAPGEADRRALGLPEEVPLALFVGDIRSPIKNLDGVLRALRQIPELHLAVAGRLAGSPYPELAHELGVADRAHFLGFRKDVAALMRGVDFFTLPSRRDSCPLVLLEAMASGLPVVVSRRVGTADLVDASNGFVIDRPDDHEALADSFRALARNSEERRKMGEAARQVARKYHWERMAEQYLDLLEDHAQAPAVPA